MSKEYDLYLEEHKANVAKGFYWIKENLPELLYGLDEEALEQQICHNHDASKTQSDEYDAYDKYFYGDKKRSYEVLQNFDYAWLTHIHRNPHHWQYWVLFNDDPSAGSKALDMPYNYILEMICDWWSFSWKENKLEEIFDWFNEHNDYMKLSEKTRTTVENILLKLDTKLQYLDMLAEVEKEEE